MGSRIKRQTAATSLLLILLLSLHPKPATGADDLRGLLAELDGEDDPATRVSLVRRLASRDSTRAASVRFAPSFRRVGIPLS